MNMDMLLPSDHSRITNFGSYWKSQTEDFVENHIDERRVETVKNGSNASVKVRLPRYELPKSHVNVLEFTALWEQFEDSIHSRLDISASTKSSYLRSYLSGPALAAGSDLSTTAANYPAAIEILKNRFNRKNVVIQNYIRKLLVLEPCIKPLAEKLQQLHDQLYLHVSALGALGNDLSSTQITAAEFVMELFKQKLPIVSQKKWEEEIFTDISKIRIEQSVIVKQDLPQARFSKATRANAERLTTTAALEAKIEPRPNRCAICDGGHIIFHSTPEVDGLCVKNKVYVSCMVCLRKVPVKKQCSQKKLMRLPTVTHQEEMANRLGLKGHSDRTRENITFGGLFWPTQETATSKNVKHELENIPMDALCVPAIFRLSANLKLSVWKHLKNIELAYTYPRTAVEIDGKEKVPCVIKSQIRWILVGLIPSTTAEDKGTMLLSKFENECDCEVIDVAEIEDQAELLNKTASFLKKSTTCDGARYVVELPWINNQ
ncbi:hypothetical protein T11_10587 [Trichinella zimbabwensis]|uniref:Uncharacterized protein n=1 Tax=Trichinella zimbabwensis TaxID=268475 RepID=A0A0V1HUB2_9BILA|nr:hypothetical protein T11_10587 [Trichinella zimbabwensis]